MKIMKTTKTLALLVLGVAAAGSSAQAQQRVVAPAGVADTLIARTADVMLKERRKLILVARETPYSLIHLRNMTTVTEAGGIICPASPSFYSKPSGVEELAMTVVNRALSLAGVRVDAYRWNALLSC